MKTPLSQLKQAIYASGLCAALPHCCPAASFVAAAKPFTRIIKRLVMPQPRPHPRPLSPISLVNQATKRLLKEFHTFSSLFLFSCSSFVSFVCLLYWSLIFDALICQLIT